MSRRRPHNGNFHLLLGYSVALVFSSFCLVGSFELCIESPVTKYLLPFTKLGSTLCSVGSWKTLVYFVSLRKLRYGQSRHLPDVMTP